MLSVSNPSAAKAITVTHTSGFRKIALLGQVDFSQASSTFAADMFVTSVLFTPNIAALLFASDAAFQAGPCSPKPSCGPPVRQWCPAFPDMNDITQR